MADTNKKEYTSNLHPKGDMDTTVYPNVKSENIIDKDTTAYTAGKVPDSSLVSKSLDGLSENLETTKIQVDTNKTNIAKNTQDIDNLRAVMPTDINVDTNGYAILEHDGTEITGQTKKVKFAQIDKSASFSEVTIPTVSDLKTQDGSTFSGGSKLYNGTEYLPTFDIATLKDTYLPLTGGNINGNLTVKGELNVPDYGIQVGIGGIYLKETTVSVPPLKTGGFYSYAVKQWASSSGIYFGISQNVFMKGGEDYDLINVGSEGTLICSISNPISLRLYKKSDKSVIQELTISDNGVKINDKDIITTEQLDAKQDKRFLHTVEIHYASNGSYFCFTGTSDKNTPIDSVEKLTTVFANRDFGGVGVFGSAGLSKIHVGSSVNDTTFKQYMNNGEYANPSEETFAMVFNPTGFTITDSVNPL